MKYAVHNKFVSYGKYEAALIWGQLLKARLALKFNPLFFVFLHACLFKNFSELRI